jgi:class 3 adenylate cyclase
VEARLVSLGGVSLPAGTVTLLFSDIEGSTRLLQQLADDYAAVEAEHRRIMRESCTGAGGYEIDRQGDAFFFSFTSTREAVAGAVSAQRALAANDWPDGVELKVRMGLHTGEPSVGDEGYLGLDVVRAARIGAAAHGGQILVSETTKALLGPAAELKEIGEYTLKDMDHPERLYQVVVDGLPTAFPEPRTKAPVPVEPGRQSELAERINDYVERSLAQAFEGAAELTPLDAVKAVLEAPSSKERLVAGERSRTAKAQSLLYLFFILAFGLVGLAWVIKILFF